MKINTLDVLEKMRKEYAFSNQKIAEVVGVDHESVRNWWLGRVPNHESKAKLLRAYKKYEVIVQDKAPNQILEILNPKKSKSPRQMLEILNHKNRVSYVVMSKLIGVSSSTVFNWLSGRRVPAENYIERIEEAYFKYYPKAKLNKEVIEKEEEVILEEAAPTIPDSWLKFRDALRLDIFMARSTAANESDRILLETMNYLHERLSQ